MLVCQHERHCEQLIIRLCLSKQCIQRRKACEACWIELHQEHLFDCITFPFVRLILLREKCILQKFQAEIQQSQHSNHQKLQMLGEKVASLLMLMNKSIENLQQQEFVNLDSIITISFKCYNRIIEQELLHQIIVEFSPSYEQLGTILKKQLQLIYDEDDKNFEFEKLNFQSDDLIYFYWRFLILIIFIKYYIFFCRLFATQKFDQALELIEMLLEQKFTKELASKKCKNQFNQIDVYR